MGLTLIKLGKIGTRTYAYTLDNGDVLSPNEMREKLLEGVEIKGIRLQKTTSGDYFVRPSKTIPVEMLEYDPFNATKKPNTKKQGDLPQLVEASKEEEKDELLEAEQNLIDGYTVLGADVSSNVANKSGGELVSSLKGSNKKALTPQEQERENLRKALAKTVSSQDVLSNVRCVFLDVGNVNELATNLFAPLLADMKEKGLLDDKKITTLQTSRKNKNCYNSMLVGILVAQLEKYLENAFSKEQLFIYLTELFIGCRQELHYIGNVEPKNLHKEIKGTTKEFYTDLYEFSSLVGCIRNDITCLITGANVGNLTFLEDKGETKCRKWLEKIAKKLPTAEIKDLRVNNWLRNSSDNFVDSIWWWEEEIIETPTPTETKEPETTETDTTDEDSIEEDTTTEETTKKVVVKKSEW